MIREFWVELNTPSDFYDDPYGGALNQLGHIALGAFLSALFCVSFFKMAGEMPVRGAVISAFVVVYGGIIEWAVQRSRMIDGLQDTLFFMMGVCIVVLSFKEASISDNIVYLSLEVGNAFATLGCSVLCLVLYIIPRARRKYGA